MSKKTIWLLNIVLILTLVVGGAACAPVPAEDPQDRCRSIVQWNIGPEGCCIAYCGCTWPSPSGSYTTPCPDNCCKYQGTGSSRSCHKNLKRFRS